MHTKKINESGRVVIPKELLKIFQLQEGDYVDITHNETQIIIEPHRNHYVCAITGKITSEAIKVGEAWISKEGMKEIMAYMSGE
ncbi:AbrB/MazE/SpoVT family DNA-binding domain-containing protein [Planococcus lenghuensis]|uniref:SpoVT-AbrB domain-containing protein n=1 Tax=Planococcus lenghuensis TaxID=2213202 RepID=A0A1Q2L565_9BACL|nr:AbrB/MazE/SpoVT family DNA-binding domain-containing protein [Planococcus lenghuensis]AQQ55595.1 hypothetical protein B0X71_20700 [Planococcus lenghuensis]